MELVQSEVAGGFGVSLADLRNNATLIRTNLSPEAVEQRNFRAGPCGPDACPKWQRIHEGMAWGAAGDKRTTAIEPDHGPRPATTTVSMKHTDVSLNGTSGPARKVCENLRETHLTSEALSGTATLNLSVDTALDWGNSDPCPGYDLPEWGE